MNIFFKEYSTDKNLGRGAKAWKKFGLTQLWKLHAFYGFSPDNEAKLSLENHCE